MSKNGLSWFRNLYGDIYQADWLILSYLDVVARSQIGSSKILHFFSRCAPRAHVTRLDFHFRFQPCLMSPRQLRNWLVQRIHNVTLSREIRGSIAESNSPRVWNAEVWFSSQMRKTVQLNHWKLVSTVRKGKSFLTSTWYNKYIKLQELKMLLKVFIYTFHHDLRELIH